MKKIGSVIMVIMMCVSLAGCSNKSNHAEEAVPVTDTEDKVSAVADAAKEEAEEGAESTQKEVMDAEIHVGALKGPTAMGMVKMMEDSAAGSNAYDFTIAAAIDEITPALVKGELDIAAVPANLASVLYNNTQGQVEVLAINTLGVLYIVEKGDSIQSVEDLRGKTIYSSGKGATPEYALDYLLTANGIDPETDVTIEYKAEHTECVAALASDEDGIAVLPQPFVTTAKMQDDSIRIALDMTQEWDKVQENAQTKSALLTGVVVAQKAFLDENPEAAAAFLDQYSASVEYVNANVSEAAAWIEKYDIIKAAVAEKALPFCNITFIEGSEMKDKLSGYLSILYDQNPESVGGTLPDDAFYFSR